MEAHVITVWLFGREVLSIARSRTEQAHEDEPGSSTTVSVTAGDVVADDLGVEHRRGW